MDEISAFFGKVNFGTLPGWIQVGIWVLILWKGLPSVLDAWTNRVSKEADRTDREIARLERQLLEMDKRHEDCMKGQDSLREQLTKVYGQLDQMKQIMRSSLNLSMGDPAMISSLAALDKLTGG